MCLLDTLISLKIPYWEGIFLAHLNPWAKYLCHLYPPYLPTCGISLPLQVNFSSAIFKIFKILLFVPLFLSSWGSSKKFVITCDRQGHFPPFHPVLMVYVLTWINPRAAKAKYKYNLPFSSAQWKSEKWAQTLVSGETKQKEECTRSSKTSRSHKSKSLA